MNRTFLKYLLLLMLFAPNFNICAQKVGVVLSGGGAKGIAHVGVLKSLEENNIPIDYITGTSIGACVGALYCMGYSPDEIIKLIESDDFSSWASGVIDKEKVFLFKKDDDDARILTVGIKQDSTKIGISIPTNVIPAHEMNIAFIKLFAQSTAKIDNNFDNLMIPFRCVASDVHKNKKIVLRDGDLGEAVRASMTFPFYFKPISINNTLMFDGGIYENVPIQTMIDEFNPDLIIASNVSTLTEKPKEDDLILQLENMIMGKTDLSLKNKKGIIITNKFTNVDLLEFNKHNYIFKRGYDATENMMDSIKNMIPSRVSESSRKQKRENFKSDVPDLLFNDIYIKGLKRDQVKYIKNLFNYKKKPFTLKDFKTSYFRFLTDKNLKEIYPITKYNKTTNTFDLYLTGKVDKDIDIHIGANINMLNHDILFLSSEYKYFSNVSGSVKFNYYFGKSYSSFLLANRIYSSYMFPVYLDTRIAATNIDYVAGNTDLIFEDRRPPYLIQRDYYFKTSLGFPMATTTKVELTNTLGINNDRYYQTTAFTESDETDVTEFVYNAVTLAAKRNFLNRKYYPNKGMKSGLSVSYLTGREENRPGTTSEDNTKYKKYHSWFQSKAYIEKYFNTRYFILGVSSEVAYSEKPLLRNYTSTLLSVNQFSPLISTKLSYFEEYRANSYWAAGLKPILHINNIWDFRVEAYVYQPYKTIRATSGKEAYETNEFADIYYMGGAYMTVYGKLGTISLGAEYHAGKASDKLYWIINFGFPIFNKLGRDL